MSIETVSHENKVTQLSMDWAQNRVRALSNESNHNNIR